MKKFFQKQEKRKFRVLFLPTNVTPVNFWRMKQFSDYMQKKNIDSIIYDYKVNLDVAGEWESKFTTDSILRNNIYSLLRYCDVAVIGYLHFPQPLSLMLWKENAKSLIDKDYDSNVIEMTKGPKKLLCEIDDLIMNTPDYNPAFKGGWKPGNAYEKVIIEHMRSSNAVINSTEYLAKAHKKFNKKQYVIPNCIDIPRWNIEKKKNKKLRIGWIGGANHEGDLRIMERIIKPILKKYKDVEFYFVQGVPEFLKKISPRCKWDNRWETIDKYPEFLANYGFDIGLAPLEINNFNYGKSNLRFLEYAALKIPCIATNIEPYAKSIKNGVNGFLCDTKDDWIKNIGILIENESLRAKMGEEAYYTVCGKYNLNLITDKYIDILKRV